MGSLGHIVVPSQCVFAFCLPLNRGAFFQTAQNPGTYAAQYGGGWIQYEKLFVNESLLTLRQLTSLGVSVQMELTAASFLRLFKRREWKVVVLFSHWQDDAIEFADGLCSYAELVDGIAPDAAGVFDLCVCHPDVLVSRLAAERPHLNLRYIPVRSTPFVWLNFYTALFRALNKGECSYLEAFESVAIEYIRQTQELREAE